jgi:hypothetical protein
MSETHDPHGDKPIHLGHPQFTLAEAAWLARVPEKSIHNWLHRELIQLGQRSPGRGRPWLLSIRDVVRLTVLFDLCVRAQICPLADAARIAEFVLGAGERSTLPSLDGFRQNEVVHVAWALDGEVLLQSSNVKHPAAYPPPRRKNGGYEPLRRAYLTIPATVLLVDVILRTRELRQPEAELADV